MKKKVLLGMSGGVDSSVSAVLLKKAGYEVIGATMVLWNGNSESTVEDAKKVCDKLEIEHIVLNCEKEFQEHVIKNFIECYQCATTPNPCIECNRYLKFGVFFQRAQELECDYIATGHYCKIQWNEQYHHYVLTKSESEKKDQSYFLYSIPKEVLDKVLFPLSDFTDKTEIRKIAEENDLITAKKKDSQEVCFIPDNDYAKFLKENEKYNVNESNSIIEDKSILNDKMKLSKHNTITTNVYDTSNKVHTNTIGNIVLKNGTVLGKHQGLIHYTVGQRKGLGIAYPEPLYVLGLDTIKNEVIVGTEKELYTNELYANQLNFLIENIDFTKPIEIMAKIRYRSQPAKAKLIIEEKLPNVNVNDKSSMELLENNFKNKIAKLVFEEPQRAITPGQSVVFYLNNIVLGGGKIIKI